MNSGASPRASVLRLGMVGRLGSTFLQKATGLWGSNKKEVLKQPLCLCVLSNFFLLHVFARDRLTFSFLVVSRASFIVPEKICHTLR